MVLTESPVQLTNIGDQGPKGHPIDLSFLDWNDLWIHCAKRFKDTPVFHPEQPTYDCPTWWPYYYLELTKAAVNFIDYAVANSADFPDMSALSEQTKKIFSLQFQKFTPLFQHDIRDNPQPGSKRYSHADYMLYELIWRGEDIWEDVDHLQSILSQAHDTNPVVCNAYAKALGIDTFLTSGSQDNIRLLAELSPYYDRTIPKNQPQSDNYYMQICIALAYYAREVGEEPFGSIVVAKDGKIVGAAYNEIMKDGENHLKHAEIIAIDRAAELLKDKELKDCTLFTTCWPCRKCTGYIRDHRGIKQVICGTVSKMSDIEGLTDTFAEPSRKLEHQGVPYGIAPAVVTDILPGTIQELYQPLGWKDMFPQYAQASILLAQPVCAVERV